MSEFLITTGRLGLRPHRLEDAPFMVELNSDPLVVRYTGNTAFAHVGEAEEICRSLIRQFAERRMGRLLTVERATGRKLGWCGIKWLPDEGVADLGYRFLRSEWGKGYATEAARACVAHGFAELGLTELTAYAAVANVPSVRVLTKLGFAPVGHGQEGGMEVMRFRLARP